MRITKFFLLSCLLLTLAIVPITIMVRAEVPQSAYTQAVYQSPLLSLTPTPVLTSSLTLSPVNRVDKLEEKILNERIQQLEEQVEKLEKSPADTWSIRLIDALNDWPLMVMIIAIILGWRFHTPITSLLNTFAKRMGKIKIGDLELSFIEVNELIVEKEILQTGIQIAIVDGHPDPEELRLLGNLVTSMKTNLINLPDEAKERILQKAIQMAAADGIIKPKEYAALALRASQFSIPVSKLDEMVIETCILNNTIPPPSLSQMCTQKKGELDLTNSHNTSNSVS